MSKKTHDHQYAGTPRDWECFTGLNSERSSMSKCFFLFDPTRSCRIAVGQGTQLWYHAVGVLRNPPGIPGHPVQGVGQPGDIFVTTFYLKKPAPRGGEWQWPHFKDDGKRTVMGLWLAQGHTTSGPAQSLRPTPKLSLSSSHPRPC